MKLRVCGRIEQSTTNFVEILPFWLERKDNYVQGGRQPVILKQEKLEVILMREARMLFTNKD